MSPRPLATINEVAEYLGVTDKTLRNWAKRGYGPQPSILGSQYRYEWDVVEAFVEASKVDWRGARPNSAMAEPCGRTGI